MKTVRHALKYDLVETSFDGSVWEKKRYISALDEGKDRLSSGEKFSADKWKVTSAEARFQNFPSVCSIHSHFNPLNPELNPICYFLALLGAHHFLHVSRIRVKLLTFRLLMSYIYMEHPFLMFLNHTQRRSTVGRTPLDE